MVDLNPYWETPIPICLDATCSTVCASSKIMKSFGKRKPLSRSSCSAGLPSSIKQSVIEHDQVGGEQTLPGLLIKTARVLPARFLRADVSFTANLRPHFRVGLDR